MSKRKRLIVCLQLVTVVFALASTGCISTAQRERLVQEFTQRRSQVQELRIAPIRVLYDEPDKNGAYQALLFGPVGAAFGWIEDRSKQKQYDERQRIQKKYETAFLQALFAAIEKGLRSGNRVRLADQNSTNITSTLVLTIINTSHEKPPSRFALGSSADATTAWSQRSPTYVVEGVVVGNATSLTTYHPAGGSGFLTWSTNRNDPMLWRRQARPHGLYPDSKYERNSTCEYAPPDQPGALNLLAQTIADALISNLELDFQTGRDLRK